MTLIEMVARAIPGRLLYRVTRRSGYSLIELLVVLVILAILATIVMPGYRSTVVKANRAVARGALLDVMARQEQYYANNKIYASSLGDLGLPAPYYIDRLAAATANVQQSIYRVELLLQSSAYRGVSAVPQNGQRQDIRCMVFTVSTYGLKTVSGTDAHTPFNCW